MKVLFLSQYFAPEAFSNSQIAAWLSERGHCVTVISCVPNYPSGKFYDGYSNRRRRDEAIGRVQVRRVWTVPRGRSKLQLIANYLVYPVAAAVRISQLTAPRADVSFVSMPSPLLQAFAGVYARKRYGIPMVYWVQDLWPETVKYLFKLRDGPVLRLLDRMCGWLYRQADIVLVQSDAMPELVARHSVPREKIRVLPNTAPEFYRPIARSEAVEHAMQIVEAGFVVMFAGNIGESQGLEVLVDAADILRERNDMAFVILGSGRGEAALRQRVADLELTARFHFLGRHSEQSMPYFFAQADALFMSLKDLPMFALTVPYKLQTYLACGKPIVASINGEGARIIKEANAGYAVPAGDSAALADALRRMAEMKPEGRQRLGANGREFFERNYSAPVVYGILEQALNDAVSGNPT